MTGQVVTLAQQKGGAGKTTLAVNLAAAARTRGLSVALLDTDPQGSMGRWFMTRRAAMGDRGSSSPPPAPGACPMNAKS